MKIKERFQFKSIKNRLSFWFFVVALIPLITAGFMSYQERVNAIQIRSFNKLTAVKDLKIKQINTWFYERITDIRTLIADPELKSLEYLFDGPPETQKSKDIFQSTREHLNEYVKIHKEYFEAYIIDPTLGEIRISSNKLLEGLGRSTNPYFTEPLKTGEVYVKDIFFSKTFNRISMTLSAPIRCRLHKGQHIVGILVLRVNLDNTIYELLEDRSGLGDTGETLIVNRDAIAISELRRHPKAPLKLKLDADPARLASQGKTGLVKSTDYTGKPVLAAYGYIPKTQWGLVAKQDLEELNAPVRELLGKFSLVMFLALLVVWLVSFLLGKSISHPVLEMTAVSKKIETGDLSARNQTDSKDELGFLAESFNNMAEYLKSQLDVREASAGIAESMATAKDLKEFGLELLQRLMEFTHSSLGAFYVLDKTNSRFERLSSIGISSASTDYFNANNFEGEFGNVLATQEISHIEDIPEDTRFKFKTFAGDVIPKEIISIPISINEQVAAIISIANLKKYSEKDLDIIQHVWMMGLSTAFSNLMANKRTRDLADQLAEKNEELESQARMLRAQAKELIQTSDKLHVQNLELETRRREVEEANRLKSQFLSNMSHELRTPLNSIMALSKLLIKHTKGMIPQEEHSFLEIIERNGRNLLALISDILDLSKIEAGRMDMNPRLFSPGETVAGIVESLEPLAEEKGIKIISEFPEDFSQIETDEARVHHILENLIGNAIKFTDHGSVTLSGKMDKETIHITVSDTGIGIPQEQLSNIFSEFRQVDGSSSKKHEGTGLGLAIAYKSAKMLGGDISVKSTLEKGSTFILTLPVKWRGEAPFDEPVHQKLCAEIKPERKTVLIVDDDPEAVNLISSSLLHEGYNTVAATSGKEALKLAESYHPFAITLDILMPNMDGWEVLQALKENPETKDIPVIIASITKDRETGFALGAVGYVTKPVNRESLISEIHKIGKPGRITGENFSVMVVDDNAFERNEMGQMIEREGMDVFMIEDGSQCIETLRKTVPDVLVLDLVMPQMDGFKVLDVVRSDLELKSLPVIIVTAKDLTNADREKLSGHVSSILSKTSKTAKALVGEILKILSDIEMFSDDGTGKRVDTLETKGGVDSQSEVLNPLGKEDNKREPPTKTKNAAEKYRGGNPTVLIVEDNPDNMITIKAVLQNRYDLLEAIDGEQGLNLVYTKKPDLVILDMALPKMDGLTIVKEIKGKDEFRNIPIVAMTAQAMKGDKERIMGAGCDDYIAKPFDPEELLQKVSKLIDEP